MKTESQIAAVRGLELTGLFTFEEKSLRLLGQHAAELAEISSLSSDDIGALIAHDCVGAAELALAEQAAAGTDIEPPVAVATSHVLLAILKFDCTALGCPTRPKLPAEQYRPDRITLFSGDAEKIATLAGSGSAPASPQALHDLVREMQRGYQTHPASAFHAFGAGRCLRMQGVLWRLQLTIDGRPGFPGPLDAACLDTARQLQLRQQDEFDVILRDAGDQKFQVVREVRTLAALGLREAKQLVEAAPRPVLERVDRDTADRAKEQLEEAGATVEII
jgi:large subunit ribosomal protein L7/L12